MILINNLINNLINFPGPGKPWHAMCIASWLGIELVDHPSGV